MSHRYTKSCDQCGNSFTTDRKETRACSKSCAASMAKPLPWLECSKCMAVIGLGLRTTARLLGHPNRGRVASAWATRGIARTIPPDGSWDIYARRRQSIGMKAREFGELWMSEYNPKFPDWSIIWEKEKARREMKARYQAMTPTERLEWNRKSSARNPKRRKAYLKGWKKEQRAINPTFRIIEGMRSRLSGLASGIRMGGAHGLVGCSRDEFRRHLESQFTRGITWENYGTHWHVDHVIPCAAFDHTKPEQVRQCWHFSNLAPLEAKKNMAKGAKIEAPQLQLLLTA